MFCTGIVSYLLEELSILWLLLNLFEKLGKNKYLKHKNINYFVQNE